jgi:hypothetical protein
LEIVLKIEQAALAGVRRAVKNEITQIIESLDRVSIRFKF